MSYDWVKMKEGWKTKYIKNDGDDITISFSTGGEIIIQKLLKVCEHFKISFPEVQQQLIFPEPIHCKIVRLTSKNNRYYYDLSDY